MALGPWKLNMAPAVWCNLLTVRYSEEQVTPPKTYMGAKLIATLQKTMLDNTPVFKQQTNGVLVSKKKKRLTDALKLSHSLRTLMGSFCHRHSDRLQVACCGEAGQGTGDTGV